MSNRYPARMWRRRVLAFFNHKLQFLRSQIPYELPIKIPTANTSTPPTTTLKAADKSGVSIYRFRI